MLVEASATQVQPNGAFAHAKQLDITSESSVVTLVYPYEYEGWTAAKLRLMQTTCTLFVCLYNSTNRPGNGCHLGSCWSLPYGSTSEDVRGGCLCKGILGWPSSLTTPSFPAQSRPNALPAPTAGQQQAPQERVVAPALADGTVPTARRAA